MKFSNFLRGVASIGEGFASFDLFPPERKVAVRRPRSSEQIDREVAAVRHPKSSEQINREVAAAIKSDWEAVGQDLRAAMNQIDAQLAKEGIKSPRTKS